MKKVQRVKQALLIFTVFALFFKQHVMAVSVSDGVYGHEPPLPVTDAVYNPSPVLTVTEAVYTVTSVTYAVYAPPVAKLMNIYQQEAPLLLSSNPLVFTHQMEVLVSQEHESGWKYALTLADFSAEHRRGEGSLRVSIPVDQVSYSVSGKEPRSGVFTQGQPQTIMEAPEGEGGGVFLAWIDLRLAVPPLLKVSEVTGMSGIAPNDFIGTLSGEYRATFEFTLIRGI